MASPSHASARQRAVSSPEGVTTKPAAGAHRSGASPSFTDLPTHLGEDGEDDEDEDTAAVAAGMSRAGQTPLLGVDATGFPSVFPEGEAAARVGFNHFFVNEFRAAEAFFAKHPRIPLAAHGHAGAGGGGAVGGGGAIVAHPPGVARAAVHFVKAIMSFDPDDVAAAMVAFRHSEGLAAQGSHHESTLAAWANWLTRHKATLTSEQVGRQKRAWLCRGGWLAG